jgi:hypothetical protein
MIDFSKRWIVWSIALVQIALMMGCDSDTNPKTYKVSGIISLKGQPVEKATLVFIPKGENGNPATAVSSKDGRYELTTFNAADGAVPGEYSIKISKLEYKEERTSTENVYANSEEESVNYKLSESAGAPPKNLLPAKYANPMTSGLTYTVPEANSSFDIDLK